MYLFYYHFIKYLKERFCQIWQQMMYVFTYVFVCIFALKNHYHFVKYLKGAFVRFISPLLANLSSNMAK